MLALIETRVVNKTAIEETTLLGMRCLRVMLPAGRGRRINAKTLKAAAEALKERGAFRLCFEKGFEHENAFPHGSFTRAGPETYRAAVAGKALKAAGGRCAALFAPQITPVCETALLELCAFFERVMIKLDSGGEQVCRSLERLTGAAAINDPSEKMLLDADAAVFFSRPAEAVKLSEKCAAYSAASRFPDNVCCRRIIERAVPAVRPEAEILQRYDEEVILSEALFSGAVKPEELEIVSLKRLDSLKPGLYN